jgi:outer membrane protein assembly factor BamB
MVLLSSDQQCHCYTLADQKELWKIAIGALANSVISSDGKTYIVGPGMATAVDSATGNKLWSCQADDPSNQSYYAMAGGRAADSLKIMDGLLYRFGFDGARLAAIDLKETKFKWNQPIEYWHDAQEDEQQNLPGNAIQRQMIIRAAMINGRMMNSFQGGGMTCAAIEGMTAYVGTPYGLYAVGLSDAVPLWRLKGVSASGAPVAQGGVLYFGTGDESAAVAGVGGPGMAVAVGPAVGLPGVAGAVNAAQPTTAPAADGKVNLEPGLHALKIK